MLTLYYAKGTAALAPHILLQEAGADFEVQEINFSSQEQNSPSYLEINPRGRVPALVTEHGILTEAPAVLAYIARIFPKARLAPDNDWEYARALEFNNYCSATVHVAHAHKMRGSRWTDDTFAHESMRARVTQNMTDCAEMIETHFLNEPWVLGERFTMCDPYLYVNARWMEGDGVDLSAFPKLSAHMAAMNERPAVQQVMALHRR